MKPRLLSTLDRRQFLRLAGQASLLWVAGLGGCAKPSRSGSVGSDVDYYTCTMHPFVRLHDAQARCPVCGMNLVPVLKKDAASTDASPASGAGQPGAAGRREFTVPAERQQQIGVTYATVSLRPLRREVRAVGVVTPDKARQWQFVARVDGYVQTLHVTSPGELVEKDQPLLTLYSPDLLTAERELLALLRMRDDARSGAARQDAQDLIDSSQRRLAQWNVTTAQIADLERTRRAGQFVTLLSPFRGVVEAVPVEQGSNVKVGDHLVDVADLSQVWVWADVYQNELPMFRLGQTATVTTAAEPGQQFEGIIQLIDPFLNEAQRTARVRIDIPNPDFKLRPAMYVTATLSADSDRQALTIPVGAVMPTGARNLVFIDQGQGRLEPRAVTLGDKYGDFYEIKDGLAEGERVVASANFLIDAEAKVQGALKSFAGPVTAAGGTEARP
jgi:RND family efflux transporter MFP subunit